MRSVPFAIIWEMLYRGRWTLTAAALGANLMPILVYSALQRQGAVDPTEPSFIIMHIVFVQISIFGFGAGIMAAQGNVARLYTAPITTPTLVTWHLIPAMVMVWLQSVLSTLLLNALF